MNHEHFMQQALHQAQKALNNGEVPIGAILIDQDKNIVTCSHNAVITSQDPTAHAEILAIRSASKKLGNYRLLNSTLYVTIEPCIMCMGALIHARIKCLVFGAKDLKWGAAGSLYNIPADNRLNHRIDVISGVEELACQNIIQTFFKDKRKQKIKSITWEKTDDQTDHP
ncbi:MAG: tRNA adenosine(34) deaminase TadA [Desulfobacterales bacterium]|nr:tRNA adenosine(34) deaminase TadA [Desulfobacterales bacterium]